MMRLIFADTSYWIALFDRKDQNHKCSVKLSVGLKSSRIIVSDFVVFETITFLNTSVKNHSLAMLFLDFIYEQDNIEVIEIGSELKEKSLQVFKDYYDKDFSFTDCSSFALMAFLSIKNAVSFDKHFSQIGITTNRL
jgi:predicted nucleic acid-binding protein